jgi:hypothetical protein
MALVKNTFMENGVYKEKKAKQANISWKMKDGKGGWNNYVLVYVLFFEFDLDCVMCVVVLLNRQSKNSIAQRLIV